METLYRAVRLILLGLMGLSLAATSSAALSVLRSAVETLYRAVWLILLGLMGLSLAATSLGMQDAALTDFIFLVAIFKAALVMREYMHFQRVPLAVVLSVATPLALFVAMLVLMFPDFVGVESDATFLK